MAKNTPPPAYGLQATAPIYPVPPAIIVQPETPHTPFGPNPITTVCPSCRSRITTKVEAKSTTKTHIIALLLCGLCCCCIPYCMDSCKNKNHHCPSCGAYIGVYKN